MQCERDSITGLRFTIINVGKLLYVCIHSNTGVHSNRGIKKLVKEKEFLEFGALQNRKYNLTYNMNTV